LQQNVNVAGFELFTENWLTYKKIIDENYMFHREMYQALQAFLGKQLSTAPISVLDLGCGDASKIPCAFSLCQLDYYCGIDLSALALVSAHQTISEVTKQYDLVCVDMLDGLTQVDKQFDVVFSSYALHHLSASDKAKFFIHAYTALKPSGILILIDTLKDASEDLHTYYDNYLGFAKNNWQALSDVEIKRVSEHVRASDFPETFKYLENAAYFAGFVNNATLAKHQWHQLCVFYK